MRAGASLLIFASLAALAGPVGLAGLAGCDRGPKPAAAPPPAPPPAPAGSGAAPAAAGCTLAPIALRLPAGKRTVAIGDLHGDLAAARAALRTAGAIDAEDHWIGGDLTLVQTGDILDRGDAESQILELFARLATDAAKQGGRVVQLLGNHELMNAAHDLRYVTAGGGRDFGGDRAHQLAPGGAWAKQLATHNIVAIVAGPGGDTVISHAGVTADWVTHLDEMNEHARCWLDGQEGGADAPTAALTADDSPVWTRVWGTDPVDCAALADVLKRLGAARMVVAHTPQRQGITSACDGTLWRIDTGMTSYYGGPIEVLELGEVPKILHGTR